MKTLTLIFLMAVSLFAEDSKLVSGQQYRSWSEEWRSFFAGGYYMGYMKGHAHAVTVKSNQMNTSAEDSLERCLSSLTVGQARAILDKYVADRPERWDKQIMDLAEEAFIDAC